MDTMRVRVQVERNGKEIHNFSFAEPEISTEEMEKDIKRRERKREKLER
jgi:hypothetical protein